MCSKFINHFRFNSSTIEKSSVITQRELNFVFSFWPPIHFASTPILKLETRTYMIWNCQPDENIVDSMQQPQLSLELKVPTIGPTIWVVYGWTRILKHTPKSPFLRPLAYMHKSLLTNLGTTINIIGGGALRFSIKKEKKWLWLNEQGIHKSSKKHKRNMATTLSWLCKHDNDVFSKFSR